MTDLGGAELKGINNVGQVVGSTYFNGDYHAFIWHNGVMTDLGDLGGQWSEATAINQAGQIIGTAYLSEDVGTHAFLWQQGVMTDLGAMLGPSSFPIAINTAGHVVGHFWSPTLSEIRTFLWHDGVMEDIGVLTNGHYGSLAINDNGQVMGHHGGRAYLWTRGVMTDLGTLGGSGSYPVDLNRAGSVVGASSLPGDSDTHLFVWQDGVMTDIGQEALLWPSFLPKINDAGRVIGAAWLPDRSAFRAFTWRDGVLTDLPVPDGAFSITREINEAGHILGWIPNRTLPDGTNEYHAALWIPERHHPPVAQCRDLVLDAGTACGASGTVDDGSFDPDGDMVACTQTPGPMYGLGSTDVTLTCADEAGLSDTCTATVTVRDTTPPRVIVRPAAQLWPPNHSLHAFQLSDCASASDACAGGRGIDALGVITSIYSDEPEDALGNGDGHTTGDIVITGNSSFQIRSERQGKGNGRVYGVSFTVTDGNGNFTTSTCLFSVPHDQSGGGAVDDGPAAGYTVQAP
jgi:probable HAF family extracellular repeat protein